MYQSNKRDLKGWYEELSGVRDNYLTRAERICKYTLPWFIKKNGEKDNTLRTPYQSVGAEGVTNLASKLVMVLMPPNRPLFRLRIDRETISRAQQENPNLNREKLINEINAALSRLERETTGLIEGTGDRTELFTAMLHLLLSGNVLLFVDEDITQVFGLNSYVVQRDAKGDVLTIIVKEEIAYPALPDIVKRKLTKEHLLKSGDAQAEKTAEGTVNEYEIFTCITRNENNWTIRQECEGVEVGTSGSYPLDRCPWLPLRMYRSAQEDYGRGYVEQFFGSLHCLEVLEHAIADASSAAAKVVFLVHPNSTTKADAIARAQNLQFVQGRKDDIDTLQIEKAVDLKVAQTEAQQLKQDLAKVFLMNTSIQRDAERVTAEEIRYMAQQLETALGGLYSVLAKEFQKPYITLRLQYFQSSGKLHAFPQGITPEVITGVDALGRGQDATALVQFAETVFKVMPPDLVVRYINASNYLKALAAAYGIDDTVVLKSDETIAQEMQQQQQQAMLQQAMPNLINAGGKILQQGMQQPQQETEE